MNGEFRRYLEALGEQWEDHLKRHLDEDELIGYVRGELEAGDVERLQSHLVRCEACAAALADVADFFEPLREGEEPIRERVLRREWKSFWQRVRAEERATVRADVPVWFRPRALFALAASLLVIVGFLGLWTWHLRREIQQLARQAQSERTRRAELERENRRLQERSDVTKREYESRLSELESQLAQLREPQWNIPVYDVLSRELLLRSGSASVVNHIAVSPTARSFSLVLNAEDQPKYPTYAIEIVDREGHVRWRAAGLHRDRHGNFTLTLSRAFLSPGRYRLILSGQRGGRFQKIAEYVVSLSYL